MSDLISRQAAIDAVHKDYDTILDFKSDGATVASSIEDILLALPSAQPERMCVNCGRTVNNGGWYEDGRTRCPIEEHYALPKDGYCHLWEKRKDREDDYAGKISEMVVDVMQTIREAVRRIDDDPSHPFADGVMMKE